MALVSHISYMCHTRRRKLIIAVEKNNCVPKWVCVCQIRSPLPVSACVFHGTASLPAFSPMSPHFASVLDGAQTWLEADQKSLCLHSLHCQRPYKTVLKGRRLKEAELCFPSLLVLKLTPRTPAQAHCGCPWPSATPTAAYNLFLIF